VYPKTADMSAEDSLEQLMQRYLEGEARAFDALYAGVSGRVFKYLLSMTRDRVRAEDLCQTTFLKLHRARAGWIPGSPVMPWIMAIARNTLFDDSLRAKRARVRVTTTGDLPEQVDARALELEADPDSGPSPERAERLAVALERLPPLQREALALTKQAGLSQRDAALALGTTETAVKLRVHRAYEALRAALREHRE
jgi:RNA polymerase sigma-70 factor (ECF subfamily)